MKRKFPDDLIAYLEISNFERRAVIVLLFCLVSILLWRYYQSHGSSNELILDTAKLDSLMIQLKKNTRLGDTALEKTEKIPLRPFNPNKDDYKTLIACGVRASIAQNIINYRTKVHVFRSRKELSNLYLVDEAYYRQIEPYIMIEQSRRRDNPEVYNKNNIFRNDVKDIEETVDINTADAEQFQRLRGIGPTYALRIVKYRDLLGGFVATNQLLEVYGITDSLFNSLKNKIYTDNPSPKKINLNQVGYADLIKHPYINSSYANAILKYRKQHGKYSDLKELEKIQLLDKIFIQRIMPYLRLN